MINTENKMLAVALICCLSLFYRIVTRHLKMFRWGLKNDDSFFSTFFSPSFQSEWRLKNASIIRREHISLKNLASDLQQHYNNLHTV